MDLDKNGQAFLWLPSIEASQISLRMAETVFPWLDGARRLDLNVLFDVFRLNHGETFVGNSFANSSTTKSLRREGKDPMNAEM